MRQTDSHRRGLGGYVDQTDRDGPFILALISSHEYRTGGIGYAFFNAINLNDCRGILIFRRTEPVEDENAF